MKIIEYPFQTEIQPSDRLIIEGDNGTRTVEAGYLMEFLSTAQIESGIQSLPNSFDMVGVRRNFYRGKFLGTYITGDQWASIKEGTFDNMYIGDYWVLDDMPFRICDFDYWFNTGKTRNTEHHVVLMPDRVLDEGKMNETNTAEGGYFGSLMRSKGLNTSKDAILGIFGSDHILSYDNTVSNGINSGIWTTSTIELPNELMIYGSYQQSIITLDRATLYTANKVQLALFRLQPYFIMALSDSDRRQWYWLSDVVSDSSFSVASDYGATSLNGASNIVGIRPVFGIC